MDPGKRPQISFVSRSVGGLRAGSSALTPGIPPCGGGLCRGSQGIERRFSTEHSQVVSARISGEMVGGSRSAIRDADASAVEPVRNEKPGFFEKTRVSQHAGRTVERVLAMIFYEERDIFPAVQSRFSFPGRTGHPPSRWVQETRLEPLSPGEVGRESGEGGSKNSKTSARGRGDSLYVGSKIFEKPPPKRPHHFWPPRTSSGVAVGRFGGRKENSFCRGSRRVVVGIDSVGDPPELCPEGTTDRPVPGPRMKPGCDSWPIS
jgi:hypothetical protein